MKILPDSSVVVPMIKQNHINHARTLAWRERVRRGEISGVLAAHSLAETYSTLTRMPPQFRLSPKLAWEAIEGLLSDFEVATLTEPEVIAVIADLASRNIGAGTTYDALIIAVARKVEADIILTFNTDHFLNAAPDLADRIQEP